uniref:Uncharacterized protein n=1 Tax=Oryzias latipes TaxID=8090 RepID=A0A3B3H9E1_ORYLA
MINCLYRINKYINSSHVKLDSHFLSPADMTQPQYYTTWMNENLH